MPEPTSESDLVALAVSLGAKGVAGWSKAEESLARGRLAASDVAVASAARRIQSGHDPLGDAFCRLRSSADRRPAGATYTPAHIVSAMVSWAVSNARPVRIVDAGAGSGRFLVAAGRRFRGARLIGVEIDPLAAILARGHLAASGLAHRSEIHLGDFRSLSMPPIVGETLFIGNPPYVRHHRIDSSWKSWLTDTARKYGLQASQLAGLHVHFLLATAEKAKPGDRCVFITAAEWLDVNYGKLVRELFLTHLGGQSIHLIEPAALPFPDAATTAVITCFEVKARPKSIYLRRVDDADSLNNLTGGRPVRRERLESAHRWSPLLRRARKAPEGYIELGELCQVHRGQVTGANHVWIAGDHSRDLPDDVLYPSVTRARELLASGEKLSDSSRLRCVIDLPPDLDLVERSARGGVERFLKVAKKMGVHRGFVAQHRKAWWSVGLRGPAPILTTYMARRSPAFVRNLADARHINIAHGIYPRDPMASAALDALARHLEASTSVSDGRTYAGGLTKFEPREVERLLVPNPKALQQGA